MACDYLRLQLYSSIPVASPALGHEPFGSEFRVELLEPNGAARDPPAMQGTSGQVAGKQHPVS